MGPEPLTIPQFPTDVLLEDPKRRRRLADLFGSPSWAVALPALGLLLSQLIYSAAQPGGSDDPSTVVAVDPPGIVRTLRAVAVLLGFLGFLVDLRPEHAVRARARRAVTGVPLAAALLVLASTVLMVGFLQGGSRPKTSTWLPYLLCGVIALLAATRPQRVRRTTMGVLRLVCWGSLLQAVVAPSLAFSSNARFQFFGLPERLGGLAGNPNLLGILAALLLVAAVRRPRSLSSLVDISAALLVILISESRTAALACVLIVPVQLLLPRVRIPGVLLVGLTLAFGTVAAFGQGTSGVSSADATGQDLLNGRQMIWNWSLSIWHSSPWWGRGTDVYSDSYRRAFGIFWVHSHNELLQDLVTGGVIRVAAVLLVILCWIWSCSRMCDRDRALGIAVILALALESFSEIPLYFQSFDVRALTVVVAIAISMSAEAKSPSVAVVVKGQADADELVDPVPAPVPAAATERVSSFAADDRVPDSLWN
jgi:hypothetical protein